MRVVAFVYYDFNATTGLVLNGNAATSSCVRITRVGRSLTVAVAPPRHVVDPLILNHCCCYVLGQDEYSVLAGANDARDASLDVVQHQLLERVVFETTETENHTLSARVAVETATIAHRDAFAKSEDTERCAVRLRLTASHPRQLASVWYAEPLPVLAGFDTRFTFQITDQSKRCFEVKDQHFGVRQYHSCSVHGGDGFAFVLHSHANKSDTLGVRGAGAVGRSEMGFEGLENSLAVEFDTWFNAEHPDTFNDHVAVYSNGQAGNTLLETARLSATVLRDLADGKVHVVKIRYYNEIKVCPS